MADAQYIVNRKAYARPQGMLWSETPGTLSTYNGAQIYVPQGYEVGQSGAIAGQEGFLVLSDDNRSPLDFQVQRLEKRERMINGRMRSYHIADKLTLSVSWDMLPSRAFSKLPAFDANGQQAVDINNNKLATDYTSDGGAGGMEILDWYETHPGSFYVFLAYDKYKNFGANDAAFQHLKEYNQVVEMFISSFNYSVQKRGGSNMDMWNISITLEEV